MRSNIFCQRRFECGILRLRADIAEIFGFAAEFQIGRARVVAVGGDRNGGQIIFSIRQREAVAERAVGAQFDFLSAERDFGRRFGRAVNNQFGVDVEPKALGLPGAAERTRKA